MSFAFRYQRIAAGAAVIVLMIFLILIFILAVIIYRTLVQIPLFQNDSLRPMAQMIASMSGAMINLVFIMMLGRVYEKLALRLTTWGKVSWPVKIDLNKKVVTQAKDCAKFQILWQMLIH